MRHVTGLAWIASSLALSSLAFAAAAPTPQEFVTKASEAGMAEVEISKLALQKSSDENIKMFAQRMVTDHGKAAAELATIAEKRKLMLSTKLDSAHQKALEDLRDKTGKDFDDKYSDQIKSDHDDAVELFAAASKTSDPELAGFAVKTLPTLKEHQKMAQHLDATH